MGQTLSEPVTVKHTTSFVRDRKFWIGLSDMQGWRISMEDSHTVHTYLPPAAIGTKSQSPDTSIPEQPVGSTVTNDDVAQDGNALFGVFDGHGGSTVAKFAGSTLHTRLAALDAYANGNYEAALTESFLKTDEELRADPNFFQDPSGCTAVVGLVTADGRIIVANSGDSRSVLGYKGQAKALSNDHKPTNKEETARITAAGGFVEFGRVNGNLALSRALGDFEFKQSLSLSPDKQIVTATPEIMSHKIDGEEEFLVLACDGIWDCLTSQQVIDFVRRAIANGDGLDKVCEDLMTKCLAKESETGGLGCDNMTVVVVALLGGRTKEEWQSWVKERVERKVGRDTPQSIADPFANQPSSSFGGLTGGGFRVAGSGGLANIASILGASGISFRPTEDSDDEDGKDKIRDVDMDSGDESDETTTEDASTAASASSTAPASIPGSGSSTAEPEPIRPSFTSIGSPAVPTHEQLQRTREHNAVFNSVPRQLTPQPGGDAYPASAKIEGLLDKSENPLA